MKHQLCRVLIQYNPIFPTHHKDFQDHPPLGLHIAQVFSRPPFPSSLQVAQISSRSKCKKYLCLFVQIYGLNCLPPGPFAKCHSYEDPQPFFTACIYDLCSNLPEEGGICNSLEEYAGLCRSRGGQPEDWRAETPQCRKFHRLL